MMTILTGGKKVKKRKQKVREQNKDGKEKRGYSRLGF